MALIILGTELQGEGAQGMVKLALCLWVCRAGEKEEKDLVGRENLKNWEIIKG